MIKNVSYVTNYKLLICIQIPFKQPDKVLVIHFLMHYLKQQFF